jgi:hypothetical protein
MARAGHNYRKRSKKKFPEFHREAPFPAKAGSHALGPRSAKKDTAKEGKPVNPRYPERGY